MPALLTRAETIALIRRAQAGDRHAEDALLRQNDRLAHKVASQFVRRARGLLDYDDLLQHARLGLLSAARAYDPGHGGAFSTYAVPAMMRHCQRAIADADVVRRPACAQERGVAMIPVLSLDHPLTEGQTDTLGELLASEDNVEASAVGGVWVGQALALLGPRERAAVTLHVLREQTLQEVADALHLSREGARRAARRGLELIAERAA